MSASVLIKVGALELQCEGSEEFLKEHIPQLLSFAEAQSSKLPVSASPGIPNDTPPTKNENKLSISSIASKLGGSSGPELIIAACLRLTRDGQQTFKRAEILFEMKSATSYYKTSYSGNLSKYIKTLIQNGTLLEQSKDVFALPAGKRDELESKLA